MAGRENKNPAAIGCRGGVKVRSFRNFITRRQARARGRGLRFDGDDVLRSRGLIPTGGWRRWQVQSPIDLWNRGGFQSGKDERLGIGAICWQESMAQYCWENLLHVIGMHGCRLAEACSSSGRLHQGE